jgi:hypothetical protein
MSDIAVKFIREEAAKSIERDWSASLVGVSDKLAHDRFYARFDRIRSATALVEETPV